MISNSSATVERRVAGTATRWQHALCWRYRSGGLALLFLAASGCGSSRPDLLPGPAPIGESKPEASGSFEQIGTLHATVNSGHIHFQAFRSAKRGPRIQNFGTNGLTVDELLFSSQPGDGVGSGSCTSSQYCVTVDLTNETGAALDNLFVEITGYENVDPPDATVSFAVPFSYSAAFANAFPDPAHIEAAAYGDIDPNQTKSSEWKFNLGTAQDFSFDLAVLASVPRANYTVSTQLDQPAVDACAVPGHAQYFSNTDDAEVEVALPFPYTFYEKTYDRAVLGSNGYALLERPGDATATLGTGASNGSVTSNAPTGLYPFWDDLAFDGDGGTCVATIGAAPNRRFAVTWKNAEINSSSSGKGPWAPSRVTTTLLLSETDDRAWYQYALPDQGVTNLTRGSQATIGEVGVSNGIPVGRDFSNKTVSLLPNAATSYPFQLGLSPARSSSQAQAASAYPLSADGKYYVVNILRRNYFPPTASATYLNGATQFRDGGPPAAVFDGDDNHFIWQAATAGDPNAGAVLTIDLGGYFSLGAVRPLYFPLGGPEVYPINQQVRVATKPNEWTTVAPMAPVNSPDSTLSFDATPARYIELTMLGAHPGDYGARLIELFAYPSAQTSPSPTASSGYDLAYFGAVSTANSNFAPVGYWPQSWPAGDFYASSPPNGSTGDAIGIVDLGMQFDLSRLSLCFFWSGAAWTNGGRLEVAPASGSYSTVYDSGLGNAFGTGALPCEEYAFPAQPVRFIRATDFFMPGIGASAGTLWSVQAFANTQPRVGYFPLNADRNSFQVNIARRPQSSVQPTASVVYAGGAAPIAWNRSAQDPNNVIDGDDQPFLWQSTAGSRATATATVTVDLGQLEPVGAIRQLYGGQLPLSTAVRVAQSLTGTWTEVQASTPTPGSDFTATFAAVSARYVELTMTGTTSAGFASLLELMVFAGSSTDPAPSSVNDLDLTYLPGLTFLTNSNMGQNSQPRIHSIDGAAGFYPKPASYGGNGDATLTIDLSQPYPVSEIGLSFLGNSTWSNGGKVEVDTGSGAPSWNTVLDTGTGTPLGLTADGTRRIQFTPRMVRSVRITGYFDSDVPVPGLLENIEIFSSAACAANPACSGT